MRKNLVLALLLPALAACGGATTARPVSTSLPQSSAVRPAVVPPTNPAPPVATGAAAGFRAPRVMALPGIEGLIGANASALTRQLGTPRLDVREGDARKLQFSGEPCVLDVWLYPLSPGAEPTATYVEARRASDGLDVDRVACVRALLRR
ncbi:MAG: hypothetical protein ACK4GD_05155 [Sphingomonadaceae bacterium]